LRLRLADDLHAPRLDVLVIAGEGEPRLLHAGTEDGAIEAVVAGDELESEVFELSGQESSDRRLQKVFGRVRHTTMILGCRYGFGAGAAAATRAVATASKRSSSWAATLRSLMRSVPSFGRTSTM